MKRLAKVKRASLPKLYNAKNNLSKEWYVYFRYYNPETGKFQTYREYQGFYQYHTVEERTAYGNRLIVELSEKLKSGWNPFHRPGLYQLIELSVEHASNLLSYHLKRLLESRKADLRPKSYSDYSAALKNFLKWLEDKGLNELHISEFSKELAKTFMDSLLLDKGLRPKTREKYCIVLKMLFKLAYEEGITFYNPFEKIKLTKVRGSSEGKLPFNVEQRKVLKEAIAKEAPQLWLYIQFMFFCFIRPNELRLLKVGDIQEELIRIRGSVAKNKQTQNVSIPQQLQVAILEAQITSYPEHYYVFGKGGKPSDKHWSFNHFYKVHEKILLKLSFSRQYSLYSWKHTGVIHAYQQGIKIHDIMRQCRHSDLEQTSRYLRGLGLMDSAFAGADFLKL